MKQPLPALLSIFLVCMLYSPIALSASKGDSTGDIWIDGPLGEQPGSDPNYPDAAVDPSGRSVFVWDGTPGATRKEIFMRVYPADGGAPSTPVVVNTTVENAQHAPRIAIRDDGSFLVVWQSDEKPFPEANFLREVVRSQAYDASANPVGDEQLLSTLLPELATGHSYANIAVLKNGDYMVAWRSSNTAQPGDTSVTIQARRVGANGLPIGDQFQVNSTISRSIRSKLAQSHSQTRRLMRMAGYWLSGRMPRSPEILEPRSGDGCTVRTWRHWVPISGSII